MTTLDPSDGISVEELTGFFRALEALGVDFSTEDETASDRILRLVDEIEGGRDAADVFDSLLMIAFDQLGLSTGEGLEAPVIGDTGETLDALIKDQDDAVRIAEELLAGERTAEELAQSLQLVLDERAARGDTDVIDGATGLPIDAGNAVIPAGATLVKITDPSGSDADVRYVVVYEAFGVQFSFDIGDVVDFGELFPEGEGAFPNVTTLSQQEYDEAGYIESGGLDSAGLIGRTETFQSLIELEMAQAGLGDLPSWIRDSDEAMAILGRATAEGWDTGQLWVALSGTEAFDARFTAFDTFAVAGETIQATVDRYLKEEESLVGALTRYRPATFEITTDYLGAILEAGWRSDTIVGALEAEKILLDNPGALANLNTILLAQGLEAVDELGLLSIIDESAPLEVIEALNTAAAAQALEEAGFEGVDVETLVDIIDTNEGIYTAADFNKIATDLALIAAENFAEFERGKFGLNRESVVATLFGEDPTEFGFSRGEVLNTLAKFERERRAASQGFSAQQGFVNREGNLVLSGLGGF